MHYCYCIVFLSVNSEVRTLVLPLDVCDFGRHQKAVDQVISELGPVNNQFFEKNFVCFFKIK